MWAIPTGTSSALKKNHQVKSPNICSRIPETGSDPQIRSDRDLGRDMGSSNQTGKGHISKWEKPDHTH